MKRELLRTAAGLVIAFSAWTQATAVADGHFEVPPFELNAALLVPDGLMVGDNYQVEALVLNDGFSNTYTLVTDWGEAQAISDYRLRTRIQEIQALATLDAMSRGGVFGDALGEGVLAPVKGAVALVTDPIETTTGAVEGLGRWFGNIARSATSDDPYQEGALSAAAGWAATKRAFAVELGVDPYTDWEPLQQALVSVGQAAFAGGITAAVAMGVGTQDTAFELPVLVLSLTNDLNEMLVDNPPASLTKLHRESLRGMGIDEDSVEGFLRNYAYSPMEKIILVDAMQRMEGASGRDIFIAQAATAPDKIVARYFQQRAVMMVNFHEKVAATDIIEIEELPMQKTRDERLIGVFPIDFMFWTEDTAVIAKSAADFIAQSPDVSSGELWFEGSLTEATRAGLEGQGWTVKENVGLLLGEPMQSLTMEDGAVVSPVVRGAAIMVPR